MNREIKFRFWHKDYKKMLYSTPENSMVISSRLTAACLGMPQADDVDIMQFTGLKDKNCKEIYEGDIVRRTYQSDFSTEIGIIVFNQVKAQFEYKTSHKVGYMQRDSFDIDTLYSEVIGNIYENPELVSP